MALTSVFGGTGADTKPYCLAGTKNAALPPKMLHPGHWNEDGQGDEDKDGNGCRPEDVDEDRDEDGGEKR